jgi:flagellar biosynthesis/type III secretory pathway protein FliH
MNNVRMETITLPTWYTQEQLDQAVVNAKLKAYELGYDSGFEEGYTEGNQNCQHR